MMNWYWVSNSYAYTNYNNLMYNIVKLLIDLTVK